MTDTVAELHTVRKAFGDVTALAGVDLAIRRGEVVALLGPNGAGKTTAIQLLLGLRRPDSGTVRLFGGNPREPGTRVRCGATPQDVGLPDTLRVHEIVDFVRRHFPQPLPTTDLLERFGLEKLGSRQAGGLSGGERRRVAVALAFAGDPELAVLDEPSASLDVAGRLALWNAIRSFAARGRGILLTTHDLHEAAALATRVVVLRAGRVTADGPAAEISSAHALAVVRLRPQRFPKPHAADEMQVHGDRLILRTRDESALMRELVELEADLQGIEIERPGLELLVTEADS